MLVLFLEYKKMSFGWWFTRLPAAAGGYPSNKTLIWTALSGSMCENCGAAKPLADNYEGPFRVLERGTKSFKLQLQLQGVRCQSGQAETTHRS